MPNHADNAIGNRTTFSRRKILEHGARFSVAMTIAGCGGGSGGGSRKSKKLSVLTYPGYVDPKALPAFKAATGITVSQAHVGSPQEMFAKVKASPGQYDIVYAGSGFMKQYVDPGLLLPIDEARIPKLKSISSLLPWRAPLTFDSKLYAYLYNWGDLPLCWDSKELSAKYDVSKYVNADGDPWDWNILWDPQFKGKVSIWDSPGNLIPVVALAAGIQDPYNLTEAQLAVVKDKLTALRPQIDRLVTGTNDQAQQFVAKEAVIGILYAPQVQTQVNAAGTPFKVNNIMKQHVTAFSDNAAITKAGGGKNLDAVYKFLDYQLSVPWQANFVAKTGQNGTMDYKQATSPAALKAGLTKKKLQLAATLIPQTQNPDFLGQVLFNKSVPSATLQAELDMWNDFKLGI